MNDATNDATDFESSLEGAIGFFQNLRRKLGALEQDASTQHDRLHAIAAAVADLEQDRQIDRQNFATLAGHLDAQAAQLTELRSDDRLLDAQIGMFETLIACFQQNQEQIRQQLATLANELQAQNADLHQELESALEQRITPTGQVVALETQLAEQARDLRNLLAVVQNLNQDTRIIRDHAAGHESRLEQHHVQIGRLEGVVQANQEQLRQFSSIAETQYQHLHRLESALGAIDQNARNLGQVVDGLKTTLDRHDHTLDTLHQTVESHEATQRQWREQQVHLDGFTDALEIRQRESQALQQGLAELRDEFEAQRQNLHEASQIRLDFLRQQDRLKHLETLIGKVSSDTDSTRQILNILQSDLITQSDTLRALDEHWQSVLATYRSYSYPPETPTAEALAPTAAPVARDYPREIPPDATTPDPDPLRDSLAAQVEIPPELRETTQPRVTVPNPTIEHQQQRAARETTTTVAELQREFEELRQTLNLLDSTIEQQHQHFETGRREELELQRELASLQHITVALEERLSSQAQAFSGNFEQFRNLSGDVQNLQQQLSTLESVPRRLNALEQNLIAQEQSFTKLQDTVRQIREDSQQLGPAFQPVDSGTPAGELETWINNQNQELIKMNEAIDGIRTDVKTTQEKVITMATNVAKRIFELQSRLTATETAHAERLQEAEQKLIQLQAALETMETQRKGRRWLSMPAMFTHLMLTVGAAFLGVLATVIWTTA